MKVIDASNLVLGRMAAKVAKEALSGESVVVVNCEKAVVTGTKKLVLGKYKHARLERGDPYHGPFISRMPDRMVKRTIRGMLPYKKEKGEKAYKKIRCFVGIPEKYSNEKIETFAFASSEKLKNPNFVKLEEVAKELGARL